MTKNIVFLSLLLLINSNNNIISMRENQQTTELRNILNRNNFNTDDLQQAVTLIQNGADVNLTNDNHRTALIMAAALGDMVTVQTLLNLGANPDIKDKYSYTALMWAVIFGHKNIVNLLLNNDANLDAQNNDGDNALTIAEKLHEIDIAQLIKERMYKE